MKKNNKKNQQKNKGNNSNLVNQVRIIGGKFKRSQVTFVDGDGLRPTPDRMRETLFNWLMNDTFDAKVLDAFAGSGVLGFETLSRGADSVTFFENNKNQYQQLLKTAEHLKLPADKAIIHYGNAESLIPQMSTKPYDLVFLDPPYILELWQPTIYSLKNSGLIHPKTYIYVEADKPIHEVFGAELLSKIQIVKEKSMGQLHSWLIQIK